jgi:hypothetical protein
LVANSHATEPLHKRIVIRPDRLSYDLFSSAKFFRKYFQIAHKSEQKQWSGAGIPTIQLGDAHLIVWHNSFFLS